MEAELCPFVKNWKWTYMYKYPLKMLTSSSEVYEPVSETVSRRGCCLTCHLTPGLWDSHVEEIIGRSQDGGREQITKTTNLTCCLDRLEDNVKTTQFIYYHLECKNGKSIYI